MLPAGISVLPWLQEKAASHLLTDTHPSLLRVRQDGLCCAWCFYFILGKMTAERVHHLSKPLLIESEQHIKLCHTLLEGKGNTEEVKIHASYRDCSQKISASSQQHLACKGDNIWQSTRPHIQRYIWKNFPNSSGMLLSCITMDFTQILRFFNNLCQPMTSADPFPQGSPSGI